MALRLPRGPFVHSTVKGDCNTIMNWYELIYVSNIAQVPG